jgi:hypothetical protein
VEGAPHFQSFAEALSHIGNVRMKMVRSFTGPDGVCTSKSQLPFSLKVASIEGVAEWLRRVASHERDTGRNRVRTFASKYPGQVGLGV